MTSLVIFMVCWLIHNPGFAKETTASKINTLKKWSKIIKNVTQYERCVISIKRSQTKVNIDRP
jgi:hypothetical protein